MREWYINTLAAGRVGNADLAAYFFLRAAHLVKNVGVLGLLGTNTIAQGDTAEVGLAQLGESGLTIVSGVRSRPWPAASAHLEFAAIWGSFGPVSDLAPRDLDGEIVKGITSLLEPTGRISGKPFRLLENGGVAFIGALLNGVGFNLPEATALEMIKQDARNADVLRPFLGGRELNETPDSRAQRWVVDFFRRTYEDAATYVEPMAWVSQHVKPHRVLLANKPHLQENWWRFEALAVGLRENIYPLEEVLSIALVSRTVMPVRVKANHVFSHKVAVFATESHAQQAILSSSTHWSWASKYGSTMRSDLNYSPTDVFLTFPRPSETPELHTSGRTLDSERREIMVRRDLGLTKLYNLVNDETVSSASDPDVARMRVIHVELDKAVMAAYGWDDVPLNHGFHTYRQMTRWTVCPEARVEILDRLLEENHRRAALQGNSPTPREEDEEGDA